MSCHHRQTQRQIERLFLGQLSARQWELLLQKLDGCQRCGRLYQAYAGLEAALADSTGVANNVTIDRVGQAILQKVASQHTADQKSKSWQWLLVPLAAALALVALAVFPKKSGDHRTELAPSAHFSTEIRSKGGTALTSPQVGFRMFRVVQQPNKATVEQSRSELSVKSVVTFTYTNLTKDHNYLTLFGAQLDGPLLWYYPDYEQTRSVAIEQNVVDNPLGHGFVFEVNHVPGDLHIVGLFCTESLDSKKIEQMKRPADFGLQWFVEMASEGSQECLGHGMTITLSAAGGQ